MFERLNNAVESRPTEQALDEELNHLIDALDERSEMSCTGNVCGARACAADL
jgi:hypothetical protein